MDRKEKGQPDDPAEVFESGPSGFDISVPVTLPEQVRDSEASESDLNIIPLENPNDR